MPKTLVILICSILLDVSLSNANPTTEELRKAFHESVLSSDKLPEFIRSIAELTNPTPIEKAYMGASEALKARDTWNPIDKLAYINKYRKYVNEAVIDDGDNIEIRFIRFSIEYNIPELIRSKKSIMNDKLVIMDKLSELNTFEVDKTFVNYILTFFEDTKSCSQYELTVLRNKLTVN